MKWPIVQLGDILSLEYGRALRKDARDQNGSTPVAGSNGIDGWHTQALVKGPGIVVGRKGSAGKVTWFDKDFWPIDTTYYVKPKIDCELRWIYYLLSYLQLDRLSIITGVPGLNRNDAYRVSFGLPPLSEQRRIVEILDQADELRKKRAEADAKAARILPALFYKMFGDPATNPKGWPTGPLSELANLQGGFAFKSNDFTQNGALLIRIGNLVNGTVRYDKKSAFLPKYFLEEFEKYVLLQGDLLVALTGATTGKLARYCCDLPALLNQRVGRFIPLEGKRETLDYLDFLMQTDYAQNYIWQYARGFGQPNIAPRQIESMAIPIPPEEMISKFSNLAQDILKNTTSQNTASSKIDNVFDVLLHRAFTGDLTAKWREAHMKEILSEMKDQAKVLKQANTFKPTRRRRRKAVK